MQGLIMKTTNTKLTTIRKFCPSCKSILYTSLCKVNNSDIGIKKYLCTHYAEKASNIDLNELDFELVQCKNCNLTYQTHVPNEKLLTEIYDVWIPKSTNEERLIGHDLNYYR
jgi:transcription elongation factor Elf1